MSQPQITIDIVIIIVVIMIISEQVCVREPAPDQAGRGHLSGLGCTAVYLGCTALYAHPVFLSTVLHFLKDTVLH